MKAIENIFDLPIGHSIDWKFGLITRDVCRISKNRFEITDTSHGWVNVKVSTQQMLDLLNGNLSLSELNWQ